MTMLAETTFSHFPQVFRNILLFKKTSFKIFWKNLVQLVRSFLRFPERIKINFFAKT